MEFQDNDLEDFKKSDLYMIEAAEYRLVKCYRLRLLGNAPITGIIDELKILKEGGCDAELGFDEEGAVIIVTKQEDVKVQEENK